MTKIQQVEVVLHVDENLSEEERNSLVSNLEGHYGVEKARFTKDHGHLMLIGYDSNKIQSTDILSYIKDEHLHAELVGI